MVQDEELAKHILIKDFEYFVDKPSTKTGILMDFLNNLKGKTILEYFLNVF